ncbi:MAG: hypothetical protein IJ358_01550 [Clostridia bacterium]|nr:hypothetical protein [Clostridia bacterium]
MWDFNHSRLSVVAVLYKGDKREIRWLCVSNLYFSVNGEDNEGKTKIWKELVAQKYDKPQDVDNKL